MRAGNVHCYSPSDMWLDSDAIQAAIDTLAEKSGRARTIRLRTEPGTMTPRMPASDGVPVVIADDRTGEHVKPGLDVR